MVGKLSKKTSILMVLVFIALLTGGAWIWQNNQSARPELTIQPYEYMLPAWSTALSGHDGITPETIETIATLDGGLTQEDTAALKVLAGIVIVADLTGKGRETYPDYWPPLAGGNVLARCSDVNIQAISPAALPSTSAENVSYAKILVVWTGICEDAPTEYEEGDTLSKVAYMYATKEDDSWAPVRDWELPAPKDADLRVAAAPLPEELGEVLNCDGTSSGTTARLVVAEAWLQLCEEAARNNVELDVYVGYRDPSQQADLFKEAESAGYGSERIAYSDGTTCDSKHCSGTALDVGPATGLSWLQETVGCNVNGNITLGSDTCNGQPIKRLHRYGFNSPDSNNLAHLEFVLPLGSQQVANCSPSNSITVAETVAQIFRCRLEREGFSPEIITGTVAEALVVSQCESLWNPRALALNGKFRDAAHPSTGEKITEGGVFMLGDPLGKWAPKSEDRLDAVQNINAAASLWLATRDWSQWECATGLPSPYASGPVLPQYGGPELPSWAYQY